MEEVHFNKSDKSQLTKIMKPKVVADKSGANIHLAFFGTSCGGGQAFLGNLCRAYPLAVNCIADWFDPLHLAEIVTHEIGHVLGMRHDSDLGCGKVNGDRGHMSGTHNRWSSCSKNQFSKRYTEIALSKKDKWCLEPG